MSTVIQYLDEDEGIGTRHKSQQRDNSVEDIMVKQRVCGHWESFADATQGNERRARSKVPLLQLVDIRQKNNDRT
jgi:hypothetical protein